MNLTSAQFISLLSTLLKIIGTAVVAHGTLGINGAMWEQITGGVLMLAPVIWDMFRHTDSAAIVRAAAISPEGKVAAFANIPDSVKIDAVTALPDVEKIVVQPTAADGVGAALADPAQTKVVSQ